MHVTPRQSAREQILRDLTRIGREQLASVGAASLSVRAVTRDLGVSSSAVYRYVRSRNEFLTLLLVDGFTELADAVDAAVDPLTSPRQRFLALGRAVRAWALQEPATYALIFGSPVPGYDAPGEQTTIPGTRVIYALVGILDDAHQKGELAAAPAPTDVGLDADLVRIRAGLSVSLPDDLLVRGVLVWSALFGAVSFEVFGQYGPDTFSNPAALFEHHLNLLAATAGFSVT